MEAELQTSVAAPGGGGANTSGHAAASDAATAMVDAEAGQQAEGVAAPGKDKSGDGAEGVPIVYSYTEAQIAVVLEALMAAKRTIRSSTPLPVPGADGWQMRWVRRGGGRLGPAGDPYWLTPSGDEVRSGPEAVRWMQSGGALAPNKARASRSVDDPAGERRRRELDPCLRDAEEMARPLSARSSLLLTPILAGDAERLKVVLERDAGHSGNATVGVGMLQKAAAYRAPATAHLCVDSGERAAALVALLLQHLPEDASARSALLNALDGTGHTALSIACLDRSPEGESPAARLAVVRSLINAGASIGVATRGGKSSALNEVGSAARVEPGKRPGRRHGRRTRPRTTASLPRSSATRPPPRGARAAHGHRPVRAPRATKRMPLAVTVARAARVVRHTHLPWAGRRIVPLAPRPRRSPSRGECGRRCAHAPRRLGGAPHRG